MIRLYVLIIITMICNPNKIFGQDSISLKVCEIDTTNKYYIIVGCNCEKKSIILLVDKNKQNSDKVIAIKVNQKIRVIGNEMKIDFIQSDPISPLILEGKIIKVEWGKYELYSVVRFE